MAQTIIIPKGTFTRLVDDIEHATDINDHTGAVMILAKHLRHEQYAAALKHVAGIMEAMQYIPNGVYQFRDEIRNVLLKTCKELYSEDQYNAIHGAF